MKSKRFVEDMDYVDHMDSKYDIKLERKEKEMARRNSRKDKRVAKEVAWA